MADAEPAWSLCSDWITDDQLTSCAACEQDMTSIPEEFRALGITLASQVLFELTNRRWPGRCTATDERPCERHLVGCCECGNTTAVRLSNGPVHADSIVVEVDGVTLETSEYALTRNRWLIGMAQPGGGIRRWWPCCQDLGRPLGEVGTWAVTYDWGNLPPTGSVIPSIMLARDYANACSSGTCAACSIPDDVVSLVRQGMSIQLPDPRALAQDGWTGVGITDAWLAALRYGAAKRRATATRPGMRQAQRVTTP